MGPQSADLGSASKLIGLQRLRKLGQKLEEYTAASKAGSAIAEAMLERERVAYFEAQRPPSDPHKKGVLLRGSKFPPFPGDPALYHDRFLDTAVSTNYSESTASEATASDAGSYEYEY